MKNKVVIVTGASAGIGFTVSLLIAELSFHGTGHLAEAKIGVLTASIIAATSGSVCLGRLHRRTRQNAPKQCA